MIVLQSIPILLLLLLLILAALLFSVFWIARSYVIPLIKSRRRRAYWQRWLFRTELLGWMAFLLFALYELLLQAPLLTIALLGIMLLLGHWWARDFFPGLLFRYDGDAEAGDYLLYRGDAYRIEAVRARNLQLRNEKGALLVLPYRLLGEMAISKAVKETPLVPFSFKVEYSAPDAAGRIERLMADCPWIVPAHPPKIHALGSGQYQIDSVAPNEDIQEKQQRYLMRRLKQKNTDKTTKKLK